MDKRVEFNVENVAALLESEELEIPPSLLTNLIEWLRNKGISDEDIVDCMLYICKG